MPFTCVSCGGFRETLDRCPHCGARVPRAPGPLLVIAGGGATGKSTVCAALAGTISGAVLMDTDPVGRGSVASREGDYIGYWGYLATIAYEIALNGLTPVWCGPMLAEQLLSAPQATLFPAVHFLALVCDQDVLGARIAGRRGNPIPLPDKHLAANEKWKTLTVAPPATVERFDVTHLGVTQTVECARRWIERRLP